MSPHAPARLAGRARPIHPTLVSLVVRGRSRVACKRACMPAGASRGLQRGQESRRTTPAISAPDQPCMCEAPAAQHARGIIHTGRHWCRQSCKGCHYKGLSWKMCKAPTTAQALSQTPGASRPCCLRPLRWILMISTRPAASGSLISSCTCTGRLLRQLVTRTLSPSPSPSPSSSLFLPSASLQQRWWTTSNRPGRSKAGSMRARRFVRPMSNTLSIGSTPSMTDSSWATMESRTPVANIHLMCHRVTRPVSAPLGAGHAQLIAAKAAGTRHLWHR